MNTINTVEFFTHLKLCLATATHNFKLVKNIDICLIWHQAFPNLDSKDPFHSEYQLFYLTIKQMVNTKY